VAPLLALSALVTSLSPRPGTAHHATIWRWTGSCRPAGQIGYTISGGDAQWVFSERGAEEKLVCLSSLDGGGFMRSGGQQPSIVSSRLVSFAPPFLIINVIQLPPVSLIDPPSTSFPLPG
jgi:hypothetical protein